MTTDEETLKVYDTKAQDYLELVSGTLEDSRLDLFMDQVTEGGFILDLGCGPGKDAATMSARGFKVDPIDASPEMVRIANESFGVPARLANFQSIGQPQNQMDQGGSDSAVYDAVWANFSLLHANRADLPEILSELHSLLKTKSVLYIAVKEGTDQARDELGRLYTYYSKDEMTQYLSSAGFDARCTAEGKEKGLAGHYESWFAVTASPRQAG